MIFGEKKSAMFVSIYINKLRASEPADISFDRHQQFKLVIIHSEPSSSQLSHPSHCSSVVIFFIPRGISPSRQNAQSMSNSRFFLFILTNNL